MKAAMIAAAAGAGLMGLITLAMRSSPAPMERVVERAVPDSATRSDLADLRDQLIGWARDMIAAAPTRRDVARTMSDAKQSMADARHSASDASASVLGTWNEVREQAAEVAQRVRSQVEDTADRLRPKVTAAVDLAKDNPMWLGVAGAALAALIAASAVSSARK
ncbi:MAG: hypothetical protein ABIX46_07935 [Burkholderiaceae bacterium]